MNAAIFSQNLKQKFYKISKLLKNYCSNMIKKKINTVILIKINTILFSQRLALSYY